MNIDNLIRQHKDIFGEIKYINEIINKGNIEPELADLASHICKLAGKLQVHLSTEDKFLYPSLIVGSDESLKKVASSYMGEMGEIAAIFTDYKNRFNTKNKIIANIEKFVPETNRILKAIETRITKEENGLYKSLSN